MRKILYEYKWGLFISCLLIINLIIYIITSFGIDSDTWFILHNGEYILNNGFPHTNPFTIHENLPFIITNWLTSILEYILYKYLNIFGLLLWMISGSILLLFSLYKFIDTFHQNKNPVTTFIGCIISFFVLNNFVSNRPTLITISIILWEIIFLIFYEKTLQKKYLLYIIILCFILIQLHASIFLVCLLPILAFLAGNILEYLHSKNKSLKFSLCSYLPLILAILLVACINPYGFSSISFLYTSYVECFSQNINLINELQTPNFISIYAIHCILHGMIGIFYIIHNKEIIDKKKFFLWFGGLLLCIMAIRNYWMFYIFTLPFIIDFFNQYRSLQQQFIITIKQLLKSKFYISILLFLLIFTFSLNCKNIHTWITQPINDTESTPLLAIEYLNITEDSKDIKIFNSFNSGGYIGFCGYPVYIDARPELYSAPKGYNNESIYTEFINIGRNTQHDIENLIDYYDFDYMIVPNYNQNGNYSILEYYLNHTANYKIVVVGNQYKMYQKQS